MLGGERGWRLVTLTTFRIGRLVMRGEAACVVSVNGNTALAMMVLHLATAPPRGWCEACFNGNAGGCAGVALCWNAMWRAGCWGDGAKCGGWESAERAALMVLRQVTTPPRSWCVLAVVCGALPGAADCNFKEQGMAPGDAEAFRLKLNLVVRPGSRICSENFVPVLVLLKRFG